MVRNSTAPTPSLNSDSPASRDCTALGTPTRRSISSTAMGSVGEMTAPKMRHSIQEMLGPASSFMSAATTRKPMTVPGAASSATGSFSRASSSGFSRKAPANSSRGSSPCRMRDSKSSRPAKRAAQSSTPGVSRARLAISSDAPTVSSMVPMVMGSLSRRELIQPKSAAVATRMLTISSVFIAPPPWNYFSGVASGRGLFWVREKLWTRNPWSGF